MVWFLSIGLRDLSLRSLPMTLPDQSINMNGPGVGLEGETEGPTLYRVHRGGCNGVSGRGFWLRLDRETEFVMWDKKQRKGIHDKICAGE